MASLPSDIDTFLSTTFTHLVIGGGTAGLVVAARLAEDKDITVGVLEAGHAAYNHQGINVPGRFGETLGTECDWQFATIPQPGLDGRSLPWPRGKVLGGTSALNFMTWNRACGEDYDAWEELGCKGWGWDDMLPFFMKSERLHESTTKHQLANSSYFDPKFHGREGPIHTTYSTQYGASHQHWHKTLHTLGIETNTSHFGGSNVGAWTSLTSVEPEQRKRSYSATAYYRPNAGRSNLKVLTGATVQELILEPSLDGVWTAKGARFAYEGGEYAIDNVQGEVIVCGGSVSSPQLLELSGIGNPRVLEAAGIPVKIDNPAVGENLQEHMMTMMIFEIDPSIPTVEDIRTDTELAAAADQEYEATRTGLRTAIPSSVAYLPFSHYLSPQHVAHTISSLPSSNLKSPRKQREDILARRFTKDQRLGQIEYNFDLSNYSAYFTSQPGKKYATMMQMLQYPFSTGSIHIPPAPSSSDGAGITRTTVNDKPIINPRYYEGEGGQHDFEMMCQAQQFADKIVRTKPLADMIVRRVWPPERASASLSTHQSGESHEAKEEEEDFSAFVRANTVTDWHPVGTCAMGRPYSPTSTFPSSSPTSISPTSASSPSSPTFPTSASTSSSSPHSSTYPSSPTSTSSTSPSSPTSSSSFPTSPSTPHPITVNGGYVLDPRLRVYGARGLRVVDASVMPLQISAHLQATVYAIGEKGAAMIAEDWVGERLRRGKGSEMGTKK